MKNTTYSGNAFTMPADVATRMLCNPKNKMTAKMRKRAWAAREGVLVSQHPILLHEGKYHYALEGSKTGVEKIAGRLKGRKFRQLLKWEKRIAARIKILQRMVETLDAVTESTIADTLRARIAQLHAIGSLLQIEIDSRG